jgi:putative transposase
MQACLFLWRHPRWDDAIIIDRIRAQRYWQEIPSHFAHIGIDCFVIMPNHIHGIVIIQHSTESGKHLADDPCRDITDDPRRDVACNVSTAELNQFMSNISPKSGSLGAVIRTYKSAVTRWCGMNGYADFAWQARYYDHIIRTEDSLQAIRAYIRDNPGRWEKALNGA